jgi:hypothetical protein
MIFNVFKGTRHVLRNLLVKQIMKHNFECFIPKQIADDRVILVDDAFLFQLRIVW